MRVRSNFVPLEEVKKLHEMTVEILETVGVEICDEEACETFRKNGARVEGERVFIPRDMLEKAIASCPEEFTLLGRNGKSVKIGKDSQVMSTASGSLFIMRGNERHGNTAEDFLNFQKILHTSKVSDVLNTNLFEPYDIDGSIMRDWQMAVSLKYTDKPMFTFATSREDCYHSIQMVQKFYNNFTDYVGLGIISQISPLKYAQVSMEAIRIYAELNQPLMFACCSMPGATSPVTKSGTVVVNNAEVLAGIVYAQLCRPGLPVIYGSTTGGTDMRTVMPATGQPETALFIFTTAALAQYYKLPCRTGGCLSDAKVVDWQCGVESTITTMATIMSSSNFVLHAGGDLDSFNTLSYEKYILDEQNIEMMRAIGQGIEIRTDEEEIENIKKVGPGGYYLEEDHTLDYMFDELYTPKLFNKMGYDSWVARGSKTAVDLASEEVDRRINSYVQPEISKEQEMVLREYIGDLYDSI